MTDHVYGTWVEYMQQHEHIKEFYHAGAHHLNLTSVYNEQEIAKTETQQKEEYFIKKQAYKRDEDVICNEIEELFESIAKNDDLDGKRKCMDCKEVLKWNSYHPLCNTGVQHSQNHVSMLTKNIYFKRWIPEETTNNAELCAESEFFKENKHWLIPLRYNIHWKFVECITPIILDNPTSHRWCIAIKDFKPHLLQIIGTTEQQFNFTLPANWVYQDMFECWMIRRGCNQFEVRSMYKISDILSKEEFVAAWERL